ncbi:MAG: tetratricopeptide repeat protein [Desulfobacterales bacterium]|nr:MAG: tetratricopeptide repeat protein [Desulfobacterales bacterium]
MLCPKCQFDNADGMNFCGKCGTKLEKICQQCNFGNPIEYEFCGKCGNKLSIPSEIATKELSFDEKLTKIQKYLPKGITEKILSQRDRIEGERKQVTVMFCDMAGFTTLSEKLDPEGAYAIVDQVYEILIHKVHDYEGTVNEMTGDGIMALFGAPIALEDAPQRAIRSSLAIHQEMAKFNNKIRQEIEGVAPLKMRIGLHTGPVVVGTVGNDLRVEFKAVGDTVNLASRMEGLAEPGSTYVTEAIFRLTEGLFRFEAMGKKGIKGKKKPIKVYRVIAPSTSRTRFDVSTERGLTPFVGRERELELLLDGLERSKADRGQAISIIADAGLGKSRLLYEFRKAVTSEDVTFLEGKCLSYSRGVVYHPIIDILKANFDIRDNDGDLQIREKIKEGLDVIGADEASILPYLLELLSVKYNDFDKIPLSPEERKDRIFGALKQMVLKGSENQPLIMAFENLHWIDHSSEESLKGLLDAISGARVFLIFTYRPEFIHTWGGRSYHSQINLNRLSTRETLMMVSHLLGTEDFEREIEQLVLEKTEGVPFFIEELINSLRDQETIEKKGNKCYLTKDIRETIIPSTIHDVIMARVDSLPEGAKGLLLTGSVAGREFSHHLIKKLTEFSKEELLSHLSVLKDSELLYERGIYPQSNYVFKHALTQEVAYNSLLQKRRTELHEKIGKALEKIHSEKLDELCEILAYHFVQGEDWQRTYRYCQEAGLKAYSHSAYEQALRYFEDALTAIKKLPREKARIEKEIDLRFNMRSPLVALGRHEDWGELIRGAEPLAREINDDARLSNVLNYLSSLHWMYGQHKKAIELGQKALNFAQRAKHFSYQVATMSHLGIFFFNIGDYPKQIEIHQKVRKKLIGEDAFKQHGLASLPGALSRSMIVLGLAELGNFDEIEKIGSEALEIAEQVRNALTLTFVYNFLAMAYLRLGKFEPALPLLEKGHELCRFSELQSMYSYTVGNLGYAYLLAKEPRRALTVLEEGAKDENLKVSFWPTPPLTVLADAYRVAGEISLATETVSRALKLSDKREERGFEAWAMLVMAGINDAAERPEEAKQWYRRTLKQASDLSMRPLVAHCHKGLSNCYLCLGNEKEAQLENKTALEIYRSLGMTYWLG